MLSRLLFGYQLRRFDRWKRLSPLGKAWWAVKKALMITVVVTVLAVVYLGGTYETEVQSVLDGTASAFVLVGPVFASLPILAAVVVVSILVVLIPTRRDDWNY